MQWVGDGHPLDPTAKNAQLYMTTMTRNWYNTGGVKFDGLWVDMYVASGENTSLLRYDISNLK
jgi:hypothetical protein